MLAGAVFRAPADDYELREPRNHRVETAEPEKIGFAASVLAGGILVGGIPAQASRQTVPFGYAGSSRNAYTKPCPTERERFNHQACRRQTHRYPRPLREWRTKNLDRLPGLKFMRTLWVCEVTGGPFKFSATKPGKTHLGLEEAHRDLKITPEEFDEVAAELGRSLDFAKVPEREKGEVLAAFAAHKKEVTAGSMQK